MIGIPPNVELPSHSSEREAPRRHHEFHQQIEKNNLTRRQFLKVGVALFGTAAGGAMLRQPAFAAAPGTGVPKQIPGFSPILFGFFGVEIPFFLPVETDPFMVGPEAAATSTTIWDFNGRVGVVEADGVSDNNSEGVPRRWACDVRFQKGVFVDRQGRTQRGAFGFFWLDVFEDPRVGPLESTQLHDVNPGDMNVPGANNYFLDGGLFWTRRIPEKSVKTHPGRGDASFVASNLEMFDYFTAPNAILRPPGGRAPVDASASVDIQWAGNGERLYVHNGAADFAGHYENASAQVNWVIANANGYHFSTANSSDVHVTHAYTAQVRTGSFHHG